MPPNNFDDLRDPPSHVSIFQANLSGPPSESFQNFKRFPLLGSRLRLSSLFFPQKSSDSP